jgi:Cys-tRNA(Pro)/Cys-tRNA(Cys) deacylase
MTRMARSRGARGGTPAVAALESAAVVHRLHRYEHDPSSDLSYGEEAAQELGVSAARVFKTLVVSVDESLAVAVAPVSGELDLKAVARALGAKRATMAEAADAERATGYVLGGISPIGQRRRLPTVVDSTASDFETVFVSGGRRGLDVELAYADLVRLTDATTAPIARPE